jgi:hypothetical protein
MAHREDSGTLLFVQRLCGFDAATGAKCDHLVMGRYEVAQAQELVRALRHQLHEMTTQLARVERQGVGRSGRACAMRLEATALRRDIREAEALIDRLNRRYGGRDPEIHGLAGRVATEPGRPTPGVAPHRAR